jgi:hypothetical protein
MFDNTWTNSTGNGSNQTMFFTSPKKIGEEEHKTKMDTKKTMPESESEPYLITIIPWNTDGYLP